MARSQRTSFIALHYDKIIVVVVLLSLVLSLGFLISLSRSQLSSEEAFNARIESLTPAHPESEPLDSSVFEATVAAIDNPMKVAATGLLVAAERMACIECGWPILPDAEVCRYCNAKQPSGEVGEDWDSDKDGMPDVWELQYGLNPLDGQDASGDIDRDGFTNLEEYLAETNPTDPKDRPPLIDFLRAEKIDAIRFPFTLKSKSRMGADYTFQLNENTGQTYFVRIGETVGRSPYKAVSYTNLLVKVVTPGIGERMRERIVLTLSADGEAVKLTEGGGPVWNSFEVTLVCEKDPGSDPIVVKQRESFSFDGERYTVVRVAKRAASGEGEVVLQQETTEKEIRIPSL